MSREETLAYEKIMEHFEAPHHRGTCAAPTHRASERTPACGDVVSVELRIDDKGRIEEAWFTGQGCVISQASASILMEFIEGRSVAEIQAMDAAKMIELIGVSLTPVRSRCGVLAWKTVQQALVAKA